MAVRKGRDEAGNVWELDDAGNPVRLIQPAQSSPMSNPFVDPRLQYQVQQAQGAAAAAPYDAPKAAADARIAQANAGVAPTVAQAEAQKAVAEAAKSEAELKIAQTKAKGKPIDEARAELTRIIGQIDRIAADANDNGGWFETGYLGSINRDRPGTAAFDLQKSISAIDANNAFRQLQQMRQDSPTGGALGGVSEKELELLKSTIANLDPNQGHASFLRNLKTARDHYAGMLSRLGENAPDTGLRGGQMALANNGTQDTLDPVASRDIDAMIRSGRSNDEIIAWAKGHGFSKQPPDPTQLDAARAYLRSNPGYTGGFTQAIDRQQAPANFGLQTLGIDPNSKLGAYGVASANALTAGTLDEIAGGNAQQGKEALAQQYPGSTLAGNVTGGALGMVGLNGGLRLAGGRLAGLATGAGGVGSDMLYGAAYGAGEDNNSRGLGAVTGAASALGGNLAGRALVSIPGRALRGVADANVGYLTDRGVRLTPGQILGQGGMFGRGVRAVEDAVGSVPFLGAAIRERKMEGLRDFNREAFRDALDPINQQVQGVVGQDAIADAQDLVSNAYGNALGGVTLQADMPFVQQAGNAIRAGRRVPEYGADVDYLARENLGPTFGPGRTLDGAGFQSSLQDIGATAADFRRAGNVRGRNANNAMQDLRQSYMDLADRQAPGTTVGLTNANTANRNVSILGDAVNTAVNSRVESGVFTPAQLGRASVNNTKTFGGKRQAARGNVPFRELQEAGQAVLPDTVPNSGTMDRAWASLILPATLGGSALGAEGLGADDKTVGTLAALSALSTGRGNRAAQRLLVNRNPVVRAVGEEILRARRLGGMFGGATAIPLLNQ